MQVQFDHRCFRDVSGHAFGQTDGPMLLTSIDGDFYGGVTGIEIAGGGGHDPVGRNLPQSYTSARPDQFQFNGCRVAGVFGGAAHG